MEHQMEIIDCPEDWIARELPLYEEARKDGRMEDVSRRPRTPDTPIKPVIDDDFECGPTPSTVSPRQRPIGSDSEESYGTISPNRSNAVNQYGIPTRKKKPGLGRKAHKDPMHHLTRALPPKAKRLATSPLVKSWLPESISNKYRVKNDIEASGMFDKLLAGTNAPTRSDKRASPALSPEDWRILARLEEEIPDDIVMKEEPGSPLCGSMVLPRKDHDNHSLSSDDGIEILDELDQLDQMFPDDIVIKKKPTPPLSGPIALPRNDLGSPTLDSDGIEELDELEQMISDDIVIKKKPIPTLSGSIALPRNDLGSPTLDSDGIEELDELEQMISDDIVVKAKPTSPLSRSMALPGNNLDSPTLGSDGLDELDELDNMFPDVIVAKEKPKSYHSGTMASATETLKSPTIGSDGLEDLDELDKMFPDEIQIKKESIGDIQSQAGTESTREFVLKRKKHPNQNESKAKRGRVSFSSLFLSCSANQSSQDPNVLNRLLPKSR
jgi:hypothetical protein